MSVTILDQFGNIESQNVVLGTSPSSGGGGGWTDNGAIVYLTTSTDSVGIGTNTPVAKLGIESITEQLRILFNVSNYVSLTVSSGGDLTINPTGDNVSINGSVQIASTITNTFSLSLSGTVNSSNMTQQQSLQVQTNFNPSGASLVDLYGTISAPILNGSSITVTRFHGAFYRINLSSGFSGTVASGHSFRTVDAVVSGGTLTSLSGVTIGNMTTGTNNVNLLVGTSTIPSGNFSIYNTSAYNNYLAGATGIGTSSPASLLDVSAATGGVLTVSRNDTSVTADDTVGKIDFWTNDTSTTTNRLAAEIEVQATNTITTDINPGRMIFKTTGTGAAGALTNRLVIENDGRIYATGIHNNAGAVTGTTNQYLASGTYTPTLTNVTNITASTAYVCQWLRLGNVVVVSGKVDIDPTLAASTATELGISLPIASGLTAEENLGGTATSDSVASLSARIKADAANDRASLVFKSISLTNDSYAFIFSYVVL